jgi:branched-chain amino acid transport system permease protein
MENKEKFDMIFTASEIIFALIWGVAIGCVYMLLATGLNIIFGVMKLVNFAHGQFLMIGAFAAWAISVTAGINAYIAILISIGIVAVIGVVVQRFTFRKVLGTDKLNEIFVSLGLIYIFENVAALLWGNGSQRIVSPLNGLSLNLQSISISYDLLVVVAAVVGILIAFGVLMYRTKIGLAMRATSQINQAAMLMGINVDRIYLITFSLGSALAAAAGGLYGIIYTFNYQSGELPTIIAFAVIILGGLGSIRGAIVGGLLYGIAEQMATLFLGGIWSSAVAFALLIAVLIVRPNGLFGEKGE